MDLIFHLAAILPPVSEVDRARTFKVNVDGTKGLLEACASSGGSPKVIFASSISVFGNTKNEIGPIKSDHPVSPIDLYAESKVEAERVLMASGLPWINLRISAIAIPAFLDPPEPWPFQRDQRVELVVLSDLVEAMVSLVKAENVVDRTLLISGGETWQVTGEDYVRRWGEVMEIPLEDMDFKEEPGWLNWFDTSESQALLNYQKTSLDSFLSQLEAVVAEALV